MDDKLGDFVEIVMGQSPPGNTCNADRRGLPLLNGPTEYGQHHPSAVQFTTDPRKLAKPGDVLFCVRGSTTGRMNWADRDYAIGRGVAAIRHKERIDLQPFVRAVIEYALPGLLAQATGSTFPNVSLHQLSNLRWPSISVDEQRAIAHILATLNSKIELNRQMNETLKAIARTLFKSWFIDFDPVRAKIEGRNASLPKHLTDLFPDSFEDSERGEIPKGWAIKSLSEICTLGRGSSPRPINDFMNGEVPWIKIADATAAVGPFLLETKEKIKRAGVPMSVQVHPGDLILSNSASCGIPIFVELDACIHDGWLYFKNLQLVSKVYLYHVLQELTEYLIHIADGSVQKNLNTHLVGQQKILVPSPEVMHLFDRQVCSLFDLIRHKTHESFALKALQDRLLPRLISGELRVRNTERFLEEFYD